MLHRDAENQTEYPSEISSPEVSSENDCISDYAPSAASGEEYAFDFNLSYGNVKGQTIDYEVKAPDLMNFPEMARLPEQLKNVVEFTECYVWCEDPEQGIEEVEAFCLELGGKGPITPEILERYKST